MHLTAWESFYVIVGSSAAALTGLMFVVIALIADVQRSSAQQIEAFGTPTVVHFGASLLLSAVMSAPWPSVSSVRAVLGAFGVVGAVYMVVVVRRARRQTDYKPVFEDWLFYTGLPLAAYATILAAALTLPYRPTAALFAVAVAAVLLLFVGIRNAWDTITYVVVQRWERENRSRGREAS